MPWIHRLNWVFDVDINTCPACGGVTRIIDFIEDAEVIERILVHLDAKATAPEATIGRRRVRRPRHGC